MHAVSAKQSSMGFKELLQQDNKSVFLNPEEFGETHLISGRRINIVIDDIEMLEREKRQTGLELYRNGVFKKNVLFYVLASDFGQLPAVGRSLELDQRMYLVTDAIDEDGIYSISLEAART